jgi:hypothetical protein
MGGLETAQQWRLRAEQTRSIADGMYGAEAKRILLQIADDYERIAARLERELPERLPQRSRFGNG